MKYYFQIANIRFYVHSDFYIEWHPFIKKFLIDENVDIMYRYDCVVTEDVPKSTGNMINRSENLIVYKADNNLEERMYLLPLYNEPLVYYQEKSETNRVLHINKKYLHLLVQPSSFQIFNAMAMERMFANHGAFILHSSFIVHNEEAILFTAPSGTGKSTQAELWERYEDAEIINGDRTLLTKEEGIWYANGFPVCGSSKICLNKKIPIKAIVYLEQNVENIVERMPLSHSVKRLMGEISINYWNVQFIDKVITQLTELCADIPVYFYQCTKEQEAVDYLKKHLER